MATQLEAAPPDELYNQGLLLAQEGKRDEAAACYRRTLEGQPAHVPARINLGIVLAQQGRRHEAIACFREAGQYQPDHPPVHHNLAVALAQEGQLDEAAASFRRALALKPDYVESYCNLGNILRQKKELNEAAHCFRRAVDFRPDHAESYLNLGATLREQRQFKEAAVVLKQAVRLLPQNIDAHNNLGLVYTDLGEFARAEACFEEALRLNPRMVEAHNNLASVWKEQGRLEEAVAGYQNALWLEPNSPSAHWNRALAWLAAGDFERGWAEYEWRWKRMQQRRVFRQPAWDGTPLEGRVILLHMEQGLGDMIQFIRYAPLVRERGGRVVVECPEFLVTLFQTCDGVEQVVPEGTPLPAFDVQAPLLSLPRVLGTRLETVPSRVPYLSADPERIAHWREQLGDGDDFRIGVVWQGNPHHGWDHHRSFKLRQLAPLADLPGVKLISLQKDFGTEQLRDCPFPITVSDGDTTGAKRDFAETAALMESMDLIVTADTSTAHLAGALARPVWVPLAKVVDWRWMHGREDSPWYPTMELFRQRTLGDWDEVFGRIAKECEALLARGGKPVEPRRARRRAERSP